MAVVESFLIVPRSGSFTRPHGIFPGDSITNQGKDAIRRWPDGILVLFPTRPSRSSKIWLFTKIRWVCFYFWDLEGLFRGLHLWCIIVWSDACPTEVIQAGCNEDRRTDSSSVRLHPESGLCRINSDYSEHRRQMGESRQYV